MRGGGGGRRRRTLSYGPLKDLLAHCRAMAAIKAGVNKTLKETAAAGTSSLECHGSASSEVSEPIPHFNPAIFP